MATPEQEQLSLYPSAELFLRDDCWVDTETLERIVAAAGLEGSGALAMAFRRPEDPVELRDISIFLRLPDGLAMMMHPINQGVYKGSQRLTKPVAEHIITYFESDPEAFARSRIEPDLTGDFLYWIKAG